MSSDDQELMFFDNKRNQFHVEEYEHHPNKRYVNKSLVKDYITSLSKIIDIESNIENINSFHITDILLDSINKNVTSEQEFKEYVDISINFMPFLIRKNIYISAIKWTDKDEICFFLSDSFSSRVCRNNPPSNRITFDDFISSRYNALRMFTERIINDINTKSEYFDKYKHILKKISFVKRYIDNIDNNILIIEFKFTFDVDDRTCQFNNISTVNSQLCNTCTLSFKCLDPESLQDDYRLVFDIQLSIGILEYNIVKSKDINKFSMMQLNYIFNQWINVMIYPGKSQECYFTIHSSPKRKPIPNAFFVCMYYKTSLERSFVFHPKVSCLWILHYELFSNVSYIDFKGLFDPQALDMMFLEYKKKKKCYNHSRDISIDRNGYTYANKGVLFIDRESETCRDPFFEQWFDTYSLITQCDCDMSPGFNISSNRNILSLSKKLTYINDFFDDMFFKEICTLKCTDFLLDQPLSSSKEDSSLIKTRPIDVMLFILRDIPSKGGVITNSSFEFPTIQLIEGNVYTIILNVSFLTPDVIEFMKKINFSIWYETDDHRKKIVFECPMITQTDHTNTSFSIPNGSSLTKLFYGEIDVTLWGYCQVFTREKYLENPIGFSLFINERFVPDIVAKISFEKKIEDKMNMSVTGFNFSYAGPCSSSSTSDTLCEEKIRKYVFFIIEPYVKDDDKTMLVKLARNLIYTNPYSQNSSLKIFVIKYVELFNHDFKNLFDQKSADIDEFVQLSPDLFEYRFYFIYHKSITALLPAMIPSSLEFNSIDDDKMIKRINVDFFKNVNQDNGFILPLDMPIIINTISKYNEKQKIAEIKII